MNKGVGHCSKHQGLFCQMAARSLLASAQARMRPSTDYYAHMQVLQEVFTYVAGAGEVQVKLADYIAAQSKRESDHARTPCCEVALLRERVPDSAPGHARRKAVPLNISVASALAGEVVVEFPRFAIALQRANGGECAIAPPSVTE
jgi:hypothetical protein